MSASSVVTLSSLRLQAQQRADRVGSLFVTSSEWNQYISNSYKELYDLLISAYGNDYSVTSSFSIVTDGITNQFALPSDFYKLLGVDQIISGGNTPTIPLKPFAYAERTNIIPTANQRLTIDYIPEPNNLVNDSDTIDGISGWEEYVIVDAAIKALQKEESDVSVLMAQKQALTMRLNSMMENRDAGMPVRVADTRDDDMGWNGSGTGDISTYILPYANLLRYRLKGSKLWLDPGSTYGWR